MLAYARGAALLHLYWLLSVLQFLLIPVSLILALWVLAGYIDKPIDKTHKSSEIDNKRNTDNNNGERSKQTLL